MARKRGRKSKRPSTFDSLRELKEGTVKAILVIGFFALGLFFTLAAMNQAGPLGGMAKEGLTFLVGAGYLLIPLIFFMLAVSIIFSNFEHFLAVPKAISAGVFVLSGLGIIDILFSGSAGFVGSLISSPLTQLLDVYATFILLVSLMAISVLIIFNVDFQEGLSKLLPFLKRKELDEDDEIEETRYDDDDEDYDEEPYEDEYEDEDEEYEEENEPATEAPSSGKAAGAFVYASEDYVPPPLSLLEKDRGKPGVGDTKANANIIKRTLLNFGIQIEMDEISVGPTVTRYALKPAEGVRISKIVSLQNNLELALAAHPVRIEAPIPGKSLVGVEVPNTSKATVGLGRLLASDDFKKNEKPLLVALGGDITGSAHFANIAKMPHILIAGTTGSGKSVTIHALVTSLLYRNGPQMLRLLMIDPKRVELTAYNNIPHLLSPVITDAKKAIMALKWAVKEMERRYDVLETESVRDIASYHENVFAPAQKKQKKNGDPDELPEPMPYIVILIDELADIMQTYPRELEAVIVRLAQMSRAVGIHLVLSTQRPSVNVITGLIKANIPARAALQVSSQIDSRTILDTGGAEKLLGAGDLLYLSGEMSKPQRMQAPFISEKEVKKVVSFIIKNNSSFSNIVDISGEQSNNAIFSASLEDSDDEESDDLYEEAREIVIHAGKASTSYLQRKLRIGYSRAARLMDILEDRGVIGPADGSRPREVLEKLGEDDDIEE